MPFYFSMTLPGTIDTGGSVPPWKTMRHEITRLAAVLRLKMVRADKGPQSGRPVHNLMSAFVAVHGNRRTSAFLKHDRLLWVGTSNSPPARAAVGRARRGGN